MGACRVLVAELRLWTRTPTKDETEDADTVDVAGTAMTRPDVGGGTPTNAETLDGRVIACLAEEGTAISDVAADGTRR